jgi:hypothetical protein
LLLIVVLLLLLLLLVLWLLAVISTTGLFVWFALSIPLRAGSGVTVAVDVLIDSTAKHETPEKHNECV